MKMIASGTTKNAMSQPTPGRTSAAARSRLRRPGATEVAAAPSGPAATAPIGFGLASQLLPALQVFVSQRSLVAEELFELVDDLLLRVDRGVLEDGRIDELLGGGV